MIFIPPPREPGDPPPPPFDVVIHYAALFGLVMLGVFAGLAALQALSRA
jgi:hypothetical protein